MWSRRHALERARGRLHLPEAVVGSWGHEPLIGLLPTDSRPEMVESRGGYGSAASENRQRPQPGGDPGAVAAQPSRCAVVVGVHDDQHRRRRDAPGFGLPMPFNDECRRVVRSTGSRGSAGRLGWRSEVRRGRSRLPIAGLLLALLTV